MDLFATRFSAQLARFFSWRPDPMAEATNAFLQDWRKVRGFAHPPWCLITRVLAKVLGQGTSLVLVTPCWPTQAWFPQLLQMLIDYPLVLPDSQQYPMIIPSPNCNSPVLATKPQLVAWRVSGNNLERKQFQKRLLTSSWLPDEENKLHV